MRVVKRGWRMSTNWEIEAILEGFERKQDEPTVIEPTPEEWAEYERCVTMLEKLESSRFFYHDHTGGSAVSEPRAIVKRNYTETHEEWLERYKEWRQNRDE